MEREKVWSTYKISQNKQVMIICNTFNATWSLSKPFWLISTIVALMWRSVDNFDKRTCFGEKKYKTAFFHMSDVLYELSYLIHCKDFVDVFSPIIVTVTSRNTIFFVLMKKKTLNVSCNTSHFLCPNPSQWKIQWN